MVRISIQKCHDSAIIPSYAHDGDAGFDLRSVAECRLAPGEKIIAKTGLKMSIPKGYFGSIRDRSGLAAKHGIHTLAGVVDSGYRGEVGIVMINLGKEEFTIEKGMRVAQMLIQPVEEADIAKVDTLDETKRNEGGFGSTGHS